MGYLLSYPWKLIFLPFVSVCVCIYPWELCFVEWAFQRQAMAFSCPRSSLSTETATKKLHEVNWETKQFWSPRFRGDTTGVDGEGAGHCVLWEPSNRMERALGEWKVGQRWRGHMRTGQWKKPLVAWKMKPCELQLQAGFCTHTCRCFSIPSNVDGSI